MKTYDFGATAIIILVLAPIIGWGVNKTLEPAHVPTVQQCVPYESGTVCRNVPASTVDEKVWENQS